MRVANGPMKWTTTPGTLTSYASSGDLSNAALYSAPFWLAHLDKYAFQLVTAGATVTGTFKLQASNSDPIIPPAGIPDATAMDWTDVTGATLTLTVAGTDMLNASNAGYRWARLVWTESGAAAGTVTGREHGKGV